ncbi:NADAR family protein [Achromobacter seleniivolatilans]|uniref:NADAR family protein n=1 Tax=Achromobacter seleniivolatilans TaxID=3047478 RepID=A0ABY9LTW3_9BURK|nr:NADAR family protein [Achromobacter sp. R39]WMD18173.1 NADAR family protein [Achromobacter sp. R39]
MTDTRFLDELRRRYNTGAKLKYVYFWGHQASKHGVTASCFSQWYGAPFEVDSQRYPSAEHYMMAEKARLFGDETTRALVFKAPNPGAAKALGRQVLGFKENVWLAERYNIVVRANQAKFGQNPELRDFLAQTGKRVIVEASPVDRIWGIGMAQDDEHIANPNLWRGLNLLGFALMQVRDELDAAK